MEGLAAQQPEKNAKAIAPEPMAVIEQTERPGPEPEPTPEPQSPTARIYNISLSEELQEFTYGRCEETGLDYEMVLAVMDKESSYTADAVSPTGDYGIMQINKVNHEWLREEVGTTDFLDAKQNITAGTEILANLAAKYADPNKVLMAYNMGESGAAKQWAKGITANEYSKDVMARRAAILEGGTQ